MESIPFELNLEETSQRERERRERDPGREGLPSEMDTSITGPSCARLLF